MPDDLRWNLRSNERNKVHNTCSILESSPNQPTTIHSLGKNCLPWNWSLVPTMLGTACFRGWQVFIRQMTSFALTRWFLIAWFKSPFVGETDTVIKFWFGDMGFTVSDPVLDLLSCFFLTLLIYPNSTVQLGPERGFRTCGHNRGRREWDECRK